MKKYLFLCLFIFAALISCKKEEQPSANPYSYYQLYSITSDDLINCCYKTNTYWIYIDSMTNIIDSIYISSHKKDSSYHHEFQAKHELHRYFTKSSHSLETKEYVVVYTGLFIGYTGQIWNDTVTCIYGDFDEVDSWSKPEIERIDSIYIYNQYYNRVLRVEVENDNTENYNKSIYYTNSKYGILRHDIYEDTILISSKVLMRKNIIR